tara:strand:+ start:28182 stop:28319 length:138 start_codon:yes stop_codon:yes gene_type:complete
MIVIIEVTVTPNIRANHAMVMDLRWSPVPNGKPSAAARTSLPLSD